ncbi:hypothetical protein AG1IA_03659 [Rhizoctonia solani AG-1 IA]|uniref:Uncharacterized protein n=1 Tax=Thanatephorus cucumeris (strain AG1-IA) TaxID=983506 RepID=L8X133_THACA|nr:hypothetical protein AG1IA_03659 [Rhizoctonia solani AG-1 IA]
MTSFYAQDLGLGVMHTIEFMFFVIIRLVPMNSEMDHASASPIDLSSTIDVVSLSENRCPGWINHYLTTFDETTRLVAAICVPHLTQSFTQQGRIIHQQYAWEDCLSSNSVISHLGLLTYIIRVFKFHLGLP